MASTTCLQLKETGERLLIFQVLVYPVTDLVNGDCASYEDSADAVPLNVAMPEWFGKHALSDGSLPDDPRLSPLLVPTEELSGCSGNRHHRRVGPSARPGRGLRAQTHGCGRSRLPHPLPRRHARVLRHDERHKLLALQQAALTPNAAFEGLEPAVSGK